MSLSQLLEMIQTWLPSSTLLWVIDTLFIYENEKSDHKHVVSLVGHLFRAYLWDYGSKTVEYFLIRGATSNICPLRIFRIPPLARTKNEKYTLITFSFKTFLNLLNIPSFDPPKLVWREEVFEVTSPHTFLNAAEKCCFFLALCKRRHFEVFYW